MAKIIYIDNDHRPRNPYKDKNSIDYLLFESWWYIWVDEVKITDERIFDRLTNQGYSPIDISTHIFNKIKSMCLICGPVYHMMRFYWKFFHDNSSKEVKNYIIQLAREYRTDYRGFLTKYRRFGSKEFEILEKIILWD